MGRPAGSLTVSNEDRAQLVRSQSLPSASSRLAQMILRILEGEPGPAIAKQFGVSRPTVSLWRTRFRKHGFAGLHNELKPESPRSTTDEQVAALINTAFKRRPKGRTHCSLRSLAEETALSTTTVHRYLTLRFPYVSLSRIRHLRLDRVEESARMVQPSR